jgi:LDH2 family malate/lactate/ureidoglycolate dehydrogenase
MATDQMSTSGYVRIDDLRACAIAVLRAMGHSGEHAAVIADVLVDSDLRGYDDHGVAMLALFVVIQKIGRYNPAPTIREVRQTDSSLLLDGDGGLGVVPGMEAMRWCVVRAKAREGIACAAVRNAGHVIASAPYVELAAREGVVAFTGANTLASMAAPGGKAKVVGNNPLAYGIPAGRHLPLLFDMATSSIAGQKVRIAALEGRMLPEGLIADADGRATTDPREYWPPGGLPVGTLLPVGWPHAPHKGFGLSMVVDLLAGALSGAAFGQAATPAQSNVGQFCWALDVRAFMPLEEFLARVDAAIDEIKASARAEGVEEILVPGERGQRRRAALLADGRVELGEASWNELVKACAAVAVSPPSIER